MAIRPITPVVAGKTPDLTSDLDALMQRLHREGWLCLEILEAAIDALKRADREAAALIRRRDSEVDREEVHIEEETVRLIALHRPSDRPLRQLMMVMKVNSDLERIADHAGGLCKSVLHLSEPEAPSWPASLVEMADRVAPRGHEALRALQSQDAGVAQEMIREDSTLDALARRCFEEIEQAQTTGRLGPRAALLAFRASRELERVSDLFGNICEDVIYAETGRIVRHAKSLGRTP